MNWTKTQPSKPGAYWLNEFGHGRPGAPMLVTIAVGSMAVRHGGLIIALKPSDLAGEWCGPLVPSNSAAELEREVFRLRMAILRTIKENRHLADGEDCTLRRLKKAVSSKNNP